MIRGWDGDVYSAEVESPPGFRVTLAWDEGFLVTVWREGEDEPVFRAGDTDQVPLVTVEQLAEACLGFREGPFAELGVVDWRLDPSLLPALRQVGRAAPSTPGDDDERGSS